MTYYEMIRAYGQGKGEATMWASTKRVSDFLEEVKEHHKEEYWKMFNDTYAIMCGEHYNEEFAMYRIEQMKYKDKSGEVHHAPHWNKEEYKKVFAAIRPKLKNAAYNMWDVAVALEMIYCKSICMFKEWWPMATQEELDGKVVESAINYLNDEDCPDGKIWQRYNK